MNSFNYFFTAIVALFLHVNASHAQTIQQPLQLSYIELDSLLPTYYNKGTYKKAIPIVQIAIKKAEKDFGRQDSVFANYIQWAGLLYTKIGQLDTALMLSIQAKNIHEKIFGKEHFKFALSLNNLAALYSEMGNVDLALPLLIQAKNIWAKARGTDHPDFAYALNNLALFHSDMGNFDLALPLLIQAKDIFKKALGEEHSQYAMSLNGLAFLYQNIGDVDSALPLLLQAKSIFKKTLGEEHPEFAVFLNNLANLYSEIGIFDLALPLLIQSKNIFQKTLGKEHSKFALSLDNLANLHSSMGNFDLALPLLIQSKNIFQKTLGKKHTRFSMSLNNLVDLYLQMENFDLAWKVLQQAMNSSLGTSLKHTFSQEWSENVIATSFHSNEHIDNIITSLEHAYWLLEKDTRIEHRTSKQIIVADLAFTLLSKARNRVFNEKDKLRMLAKSDDWLQRSLHLLSPSKDNERAFHLSDQNKSVLLLQATRSENAYHLGELPKSLIRISKEILRKQSELQAKLMEKRSAKEKDSLLNELNQINQEISDFEKMLEEKFPKYHKLKYQPNDAKVSDIQSLLDKHTALLQYVISDSLVHIFLVDKQEVRWEKSLISRSKLKEQISILHNSLSTYTPMTQEEHAYQNYTHTAHWFYQHLIAPVLQNKPNICNLIIVSDGELGHLPFEVFLKTSASKTFIDYHNLDYLVNHYNISYNHSAALWRENKEAPTPMNNGQILAVAANYNIRLSSKTANTRLPSNQLLRKGLPPLPSARKEVETLQKQYRGFFAFDSIASEKIVKEKASEYAILHFSVHGILDNKRPVLSSLAFTEDNDSIESNFWQAHEISKMQLNANLVVLSACQTGYGKFEKGNGVASLARAFMYAGASALIVSLWQVNDYITSEIMKNLYKNLANGIPKDQALRQAKLQYMDSVEGSLAHPSFWSPFIMIGNTAPLSIKKKNNFTFYWGTGLLGLLLAAGLFLVKKSK